MKKYLAPELDLIVTESEDVIMASGLGEVVNFDDMFAAK